MELPSTLLSLLLSLTLVSANLLHDDRATRRPRKGGPVDSIAFVSGKLVTDDRTTGMPRKGEPEEEEKALIMSNRDRQQRSVSSQANHECQEGNPLGVSYPGEKNVTASGRTCQA